MIEKKSITFQEFKQWVTGLIITKDGELPDYDDWVEIKAMMDKVAPEKILRVIPSVKEEYTPRESHYRAPVWIAPQKVPDWSVTPEISYGTAMEQLELKLDEEPAPTLEHFADNLELSSKERKAALEFIDLMRDEIDGS